METHYGLLGLALAASLGCGPCLVHATNVGAAQQAEQKAAERSRTATHVAPTAPGSELGAVTVTGEVIRPPATNAVSPELQRFQPPGTVESITQQQIEQTTNTIDAEDAIKYLPSLFLRKRGFGDTQPTIETRTWGINSSARSLVYVDDTPISALISNNNTSGSPRWGIVSPEEIQGIDMLYGPFAAEYPGNSMGGVLRITTRMPTQLEATAAQTEALQTFDLYKTHRSYTTSNTSVTVGNRDGAWSWFLSANREDSEDQPLFIITNGGIPVGTGGTIPARNKTGAIADVVGAGGIPHLILINATGKLEYDVNDWLKANYTISYYDNHTAAHDDSYLVTNTGLPTFGGVSGFASQTYTVDEQHLMNALSFKTNRDGHLNWEAIATRYDYLKDVQRTPAGVLAGETFRTGGYVARMDGTGWSTEDLRAIWQPVAGGARQLSFGAHHDEYVLNNPTYNATDWARSRDTGNGTLYTKGRGRTETYALWVQDLWRIEPALTLTTGARLESWRASRGLNVAGSVTAVQPTERSTNLSPNATLAWQLNAAWSTRLSFGEAYRYPTVGELYQIVSAGSTYSVPNPNLTPEHDYSGELAIGRATRNTRLRISLFQENTLNALISQTNLLNGTYTNTFQNVGETRNRGVELVAEWTDALILGLDLSNSVTYVDSSTVSDPTFRSATRTTAAGKHVPYVPDWRDTAQATYRANDRLAVSLAARYQGKMYSTLDNTDGVPRVFGTFDTFFLLDVHVHYRFRHLSLDAGVDNLLNYQYFEFHPFPMRTYVVNLKARL